MTRPDPDDAIGTALRFGRNLGVDLVRRYHRLEIRDAGPRIDGPVLFVANHGFGGLFDLNVFTTFAALDGMALERPVTILTHQLAWTLGVGSLVERLGSRPAGRGVAEEAFASGQHVLVFPGGDLDGWKSFANRNRIVFGGRRGFARLALDAGVPIVPIVTAGAGESLLVLSDGQRVARALGLDKRLRMKGFPIMLSVPWGLSAGPTGFLPYLPLPSKLVTSILPTMSAGAGEGAEKFGDRVESAMQERLSALVAHRTPILG